MSKVKILIFFIFMTTSLMAGETSMILFGGGGDPAGEETIFDSTLSSFSDYHKKAKFKNTSIAFDGGHSYTEKILKNKFEDHLPVNLSIKNFEKIISDHITALDDGSYKAGDQLMVMIDTHGASPETGVLSHQVSTSDHTTINLDRLIKLKEKAKERGVKLAIVDLSCHSGATIALADQDTCVVTATGPRHYAYNSPQTFLTPENHAFVDHFIESMQAGKNLEELFLSARAATTTYEYPMISSQEGLTIDANIYARIAPYLFFTKKDKVKGNNYILQKANEANGHCVEDKSFSTLLRFIKEIEDITTTEKNGWFFSGKYMSADFDGSKLKKLLTKYQSMLSELIQLKRELNKDEPQFDAVVNYLEFDQSKGKRVVKQRTAKVKVRDKLMIDYDVKIEEIEAWHNRNHDDKTLAGVYGRDLKRVKEEQEVQKKLRLQYPRLVQMIKDYDKLSEEITSAASEIAPEEKKMYNEYYKALRRIHPDTKNPCRDFILP